MTADPRQIAEGLSEQARHLLRIAAKHDYVVTLDPDFVFENLSALLRYVGENSGGGAKFQITPLGLAVRTILLEEPRP